MRTREISVFIDESGCYEHDRQSSRYYLVCMVFHDQDIDISAEINKLEDSLESMGLDRNHFVFSQRYHLLRILLQTSEFVSSFEKSEVGRVEVCEVWHVG